MSEKHPIPVVVCVLTAGNYVLLGRRKNPPAENRLYGFPGGKVKFDEPMEIAYRRELYEETGLMLSFASAPRFIGLLDSRIPEVGHFWQAFFQMENEGKNPICTEPDKCEGWEWHEINRLPEQDQTYALKEFIRVDWVSKLVIHNETREID